MRRIGLAAVAVFLALFAVGDGAHAQAGIEVRENTAAVVFPDGIQFRLEVVKDTTVDDVQLRYEIVASGVRTTAEPQCTGITVVSCGYLLPSSGAGLLIPGAEVRYSWRISSDGVTQDTESQDMTYEDTRFEWETISEGNITLWYYSGSESDAREVLAAARESVEHNSALLQTTVTTPIKVYYYASAQDMAVVLEPDNPEGIVTLGEVSLVYPDTAILAADSRPEEVVRHEITHVVIHHLIPRPFDAPAWLDEGTAVYAQNEPLPYHREAIESAIASGDVLSVRSMSSASAGGSSAERSSLFYGESWSIVKYLIDTYGEKKFAELFRAFKDGASTSEALQQVYGFNQDGLENAWRESVRLPPRQAVTTPEDLESVTPTVTGRSSSNESEGEAKVGLIVVIAVVTTAIAGGLLVVGIVLARRLR